MSREKTERNERLFKLIQKKGMNIKAAGESLGIKSKSTSYAIVKRLCKRKGIPMLSTKR